MMPAGANAIVEATRAALQTPPFDEYRQRLVIAHRVRRHLNERTPLPLDWLDEQVARFRQTSTDADVMTSSGAAVILWCMQLYCDLPAMLEADRGRLPDLYLDWFAEFLCRFRKTEGRPAPIPSEAGDLWFALGGPDFATRAAARATMKHRLARVRERDAAPTPEGG